MKIKIHFHVLLNIIHSPIFYCVLFDACLTLLLYIKNIFPYIIIESKMQQVSLPKKNQYIDFFTFRIYIIYYYIIILF